MRFINIQQTSQVYNILGAHKPYYGNTPTIELFFAVRCFSVSSVWKRSDKIVERILQKQSITSPPLFTAQFRKNTERFTLKAIHY